VPVRRCQRFVRIVLERKTDWLLLFEYVYSSNCSRGLASVFAGRLHRFYHISVIQSVSDYVWAEAMLLTIRPAPELRPCGRSAIPADCGLRM